ncbi:MAG TPA: hypothetical protein VN445_09940 [Rectinemataceae bacterium]|nr:hypothetical protein [Rectinemataceae bacterium]
MKRRYHGAIPLCFLALFTLTASSAAADKTSFYYSISMGGFSSPLFTVAEYMDFSASVGIDDGPVLGSAFSTHYLMPVNPLSLADSLAGLGFDFTLFHLKNHPFAWMSPRETLLAPTLSATAYLPFSDLKDIRYTLSLSPIRLFAGYGYFTLGSFGLVYDSSFVLEGWCVKLFELSYMSN